MSRKTTICMIRSNAVDPDPRVTKEALALSTFAAVHVIAWDREGKKPPKEQADFGMIERIRLRAPYGSLTLALYLPIWFFGVFLKLLFTHFDYVHACDFDTVIPAYCAARLKRKQVVYDVFDFYVDTLPFAKGSWPYRIIKYIDIYFLNHADRVILVDGSRRKQIEPAEPKAISYVYNTPPEYKLPASKKEGGKNGGFTIFYAGVLAKNRGLENLIQLKGHIPGLEVIIGGFGQDEKIIKSLCRQHKVKYLGKIPYEQVLAESSEADCLIATYDPSVPNHRYSSPNKMFEAMMLGKPIIVARGTGMDRLVEKEGFGLIVKYGDGRDLGEKVTKLMNDPQLIARLSANAKNAYKKYCWATMEKRLISLYRNLGHN